MGKLQEPVGLELEKNNNEERIEGREKIILKGCLGRHKATQKLFAVSCIGVEYFCVCRLWCCSSHLKKDRSCLESVIICGFFPTTGEETWDTSL